MLDIKEATYPACIGLAYINYWNRWECWTDKSTRKYPLYLRYLPHRWITWDRSGAKLKSLWSRS
jgi:hypothetical protein